MPLKLEETPPSQQAAAPPKPENRSYIPTLDGWRAIAIGLVIGAHCQTMLLHNGSRAARLLATFFKHTGYGVDVFFALSGYLICTLLLREKQRTQSISLARFYVRRAFRILPPMLAYVAFITILSLVGAIPAISFKEMAAVLFFFRNYIDGSWYTGHFWSLAVEEHFYAVIPLFLLIFSRKWAVRLAAILIALCIAVRWWEYAQGWSAKSLIQFHTENRIDGLLWGALLAIAFQSAKAREWFSRHINAPILFGILIAGLVILLRFNSQPAHRTTVAVALPFFIGYTVLRPKSLLGRFLESAPLKWIGRLSYSLYIWQMMFLVEGARPLGLIQSFPLALILPFVCASLSFYFVEKPMIRIGYKLAAAPGLAPSHRLD
ncbi:MAG TPA: acyltransferase [Acidobacteriaceae bacterium]